MHARILTTFALVLALLVTSVAEARPLAPDEQRASLMSLLSGHHFRADRPTFDRLGPAREIADHLIYFIGNPKLRPTLRRRAITALRVYPGERVRKVLEAVLYDPALTKSWGVAMRREAMLSLAIAFKGRAITSISNHRDATDPQIREGCARALGATQSRDALPVLDAWLPNEPELFVRLAVDHAIAHIRDRKGRQDR